MQQPLEQALDQAKSIIERAQQRPPKRNYSSGGEKSLHQKLYDIYVEECEKEPVVMQELKSNVNLLEKLVRRESLPCLIVNLYPGKEGYSLMLEGENGSCSESIHLPYEEAELLEYLDAEELPPILVDLLDKSQINIFHSGCVIAEIRDYRQSSNVSSPQYQSRHILLRPTMQTLACDVQAIASDSQAWSEEDKLLLESQLLLATAEPLCLDPSVAVACTENRLLYNKQKVNTRPMKGNLKRYSASSLSRQQQLSGCSPPPELCMVNSCKRSKSSRVVPQYDLKISKEGGCVDMWKQRPCDLAVPSELDVERYAKGKKSVKYSHPAVWPAREVKDDSGFGWKAGIQSQTTEPIFTQSLNNSSFSRERTRTKARCERPLSPTHSFTNEHSQSIMPKFKITTGSTVSLSEELVWKDTICPVSTSSSGSANLSLLSQGEETFQAESMLIPSSVLEKGNDYSELSVTLPSSSEDNSSWNIFTPEQTRSFFGALSADPASEPPAPSQTPSVEVNSVHVTPAAALPSSSQTTKALTSEDSSEPTPAPSTAKPSAGSHATQGIASSAGRRVIHVVSPDHAAPSLVSDSNPMPVSVSVATAPTDVEASSKLSDGQPPPAKPANSQMGVQFFLKSASGLKPVRLFQLPQGGIILKTQLDPQHKEQLFQLIPSKQHSISFHARQPVPQVSTAQGSTRGSHAVVIKLAGVGSLQSQAAALSQLSFIQRRTEPDLPQQPPAPLCLTTAPSATVTVATTSVAAIPARRASPMWSIAATASTAAVASEATAVARGATAMAPVAAIASTAATASAATAMTRGAAVMVSTGETTALRAATASTAAMASVPTATARGAAVVVSTGAAMSPIAATAATATATARRATFMASSGAAMAQIASTASTATARRASPMASTVVPTASVVATASVAATASAATATARRSTVMASTGAAMAPVVATASTATATARGASLMVSTRAGMTPVAATASTATATARGASLMVSTRAGMAPVAATASTATATARGASLMVSTRAGMAPVAATASTATATARGASLMVSTRAGMTPVAATASTATATARGATVMVSGAATATTATTASSRRAAVTGSVGGATASTAAPAARRIATALRAAAPGSAAAVTALRAVATASKAANPTAENLAVRSGCGSSTPES